MNEDELKKGMVVRLKTISPFIPEYEYKQYKGQLTTILKFEYCEACNKNHYDVVFEDGSKIVDELDSEHFIKANQIIKKKGKKHVSD
jgi:hypothetical protein